MNKEAFLLILDDVKKRKGSFVADFNPMVRELAFFRAWEMQEDANEKCLLEIKADMVLKLSELAPVAIYPGWTLAGEHMLPTQWSIFGRDTLKNRQEQTEALEQLDNSIQLDKVTAGIDNYNTRHSATVPGPLKDSIRPYLAGWQDSDTCSVIMGGGWVENHSIRDYAKLIKVGYSGLIKEVEDELEMHKMTEPDYPQRESFLLAMKSVCNAGIMFGRRYAELADQMAKHTDNSEDWSRLSNMAIACRKVPEHGATTFREAVQSLWFAHLMACADDGINANSIGHLDRILEPYYQADLAAGRITRQGAVDLMIELAAKLYLEYDVQAITLGGVNSDGSSAVTEMSYIILEATSEFGEIRDLSVRIDSNTPEDFLLASANIVIKGGGIPFFFNDECFVPALAERGISLEDAREYSPIGCVELTIPGKASPHAVSGWFNLAKCLELALFNGMDPSSGTQLGPKTGEFINFKDFDEFKQALAKQVEWFAERIVYVCRRGENLQREFGPLPSLSLLTDDCIKRGCDITNGGSVYNYHSFCLMGVPDTADALAAINKFVYNEASISPEGMLKALKENFKDCDALRHKLLNGAPKYGNDQDEVDLLAAEQCHQFINLMDSWSTPDNRLFVHLFTFLVNIDFGKNVGALPDGRRAGEPLAYSLSAHQGRDLAGLTSMLSSLSKMPHNKAAAGSAAIIDLHPSVIESVNGPEVLVQLLRSAVKMGVGQLQWNVVSADRLLQAQKDPEHYGNIPVRVAGYSQIFSLIEHELQNHIIARHKHQEM